MSHQLIGNSFSKTHGRLGTVVDPSGRNRRSRRVFSFSGPTALPLGRRWTATVGSGLPTDQKVGGSNPFGRAQVRGYLRHLRACESPGKSRTPRSWPPVRHCSSDGGSISSRGLTGLPAFGPEALLVQLAARPSSFRPWADIVAHLDVLAADCVDERLLPLLSGQSMSTWQRASYLIHVAGDPERSAALLAKRQTKTMSVVQFTHPYIHASRRTKEVWVPE